MNWRLVKHKELSKEELLNIAYLKDQHWPYGIESQIKWMKENIAPDDLHLMGYLSNDDTVLIAYITLSDIEVTIDDQCTKCIGIGGVCIDKEHMHLGIGKQLVNKASDYISESGKQGVLLCKDKLVPFYEKCHWNKAEFQKAIIANKNYNDKIMLFSNSLTCTYIKIDRIF